MNVAGPAPVVDVEAVAHGGDGIARPGGKVTFVSGAIPGDRVRVDVVEDRDRYARAVVSEVVEPSPDRVTPPCPHASVCGGCTWQHADHDAQLRWKQSIVEGALAHVGGLQAVVRPTAAPGSPFRYRNRMDLRASAGRPALLRKRSHEAVPLDVCLLPAPPLAEMFDALEGLEDGLRLVLRAGERTGERVAIADRPTAVRPAGIVPVGAADAVVHEVVGGVRFRVSGTAFFQVNTAGADLLVALVEEAAGLSGAERMLDGYAGGGLFAATVGRGAASVTAVESDPVAVSDLRVNAGGARVIESSMVEATGDLDGSFDVVVVDPPRAGLGSEVVDSIVALAPSRIVSVSCDPATFARDARRLVDLGFRLEWVAPVDMFPQTHHIETVARFVRT